MTTAHPKQAIAVGRRGNRCLRRTRAFTLIQILSFISILGALIASRGWSNPDDSRPMRRRQTDRVAPQAPPERSPGGCPPMDTLAPSGMAYYRCAQK